MIAVVTASTVDPDLEYVQRARDGKPRAFETLVERHGKDVYAVCRRFARDAHEAEDLAQEVFLKAYRGLSRFRGESSFRTWLFRITVNAGRSWIARRVPQEVAIPPGEAEPEAGTSDELERLRRAIAKLPDSQRMALSLRAFGGLAYEEVAQVLNMTPASVRVTVSLARKALAEQLGEDA